MMSAVDDLPLEPNDQEYETNYVFHDVEVSAASELAMLIVFRHTPFGVWIPRSQTRDGTTVKRRGDVGNLVLSGWICVKTDLVGHEDDCHSYYV
jgi:hypothetical protein